MDLELNRIDYCFVGITLRNSMKLLPTSAYKLQQQIVVGDQSGVLQVFSIKKEDIQIQFKTLPTEKITTVQLGGITGPGTIADKIFVAMDNKVRAFSRKGKLFLSFDLNLTESIKSMFVTGNELIICGNHMYNHYRDCKDIGSYLCGDNIVDVIALCPNNTNRVITVLACSGRVLRLLEHCRVRQTIELDSVPTVLYVPNKSIGDQFLCGYADGKVTLFRINHYGMDVKEEILVKSSDNISAVTTLDMYDITGDGKDELLIGRRDGTVEVFNLPATDNEMDNEVRQLYHENFQESISSIQGGCVGFNGYAEVVVCTYTGRIFGLSTQCLKLSLTDNKNSASTSLSMDTKARINKLRGEIDDLEHKVDKERHRYQISTQSMSDGISAIPLLPVNDSMTMSTEDASYMLSIEIPSPIEFVLLQCDIPIKLLEVDKSTAVVSFSTCDPLSGNHLLATYRCQIDTNRIDLKLRTIEGYHGTLQAFITPSLQPKVSQLRKYLLRPLSMHMRIHSFDENRPYNTLTLKGAFSQAEVHNWLSYCIPEVPEKIQQPTIVGEKNNLYFKNIFAKTLLECSYGKGYANIRTDNITTISILKDVLTKNATKKRIKLEIQTNINDTTIPHMIKLLEPQIMECRRKKKDNNLLVALLDLDVRNDNEFQYLCPEYEEILRRSNEIELTTTANITKTDNDLTIMDRICGLLTDCYVDRFKLKGMNVKTKIPQLQELLNNYDFDILVNFLNETGLESKTEQFFDNMRNDIGDDATDLATGGFGMDDHDLMLIGGDSFGQ